MLTCTPLAKENAQYPTAGMRRWEARARPHSLNMRSTMARSKPASASSATSGGASTTEQNREIRTSSALSIWPTRGEYCGHVTSINQSQLTWPTVQNMSDPSPQIIFRGSLNSAWEYKNNYNFYINQYIEKRWMFKHIFNKIDISIYYLQNFFLQILIFWRSCSLGQQPFVQNTPELLLHHNFVSSQLWRIFMSS